MKKVKTTLSLILSLLINIFAITTAHADETDISSAYNYLHDICAIAQVREAGSELHNDFCAYLYNLMDSFGYDMEILEREEKTDIVATLSGSSDEYIFLTVHFATEEAIPGTDDGASAVAVLLDLANRLPQMGYTQNIVFGFFDDTMDAPEGETTYFKYLPEGVRNHTIAVLSVDNMIMGDEWFLYDASAQILGENVGGLYRSVLETLEKNQIEIQTPEEYAARTEVESSKIASFSIPCLQIERSLWDGSESDSPFSGTNKYQTANPSVENGSIIGTENDTIEYLKRILTEEEIKDRLQEGEKAVSLMIDFLAGKETQMDTGTAETVPYIGSNNTNPGTVMPGTVSKNTSPQPRISIMNFLEDSIPIFLVLIGAVVIVYFTFKCIRQIVRKVHSKLTERPEPKRANPKKEKERLPKEKIERKREKQPKEKPEKVKKTKQGKAEDWWNL